MTQSQSKKYYQFRSCSRIYPLTKIPIRYLKTAQKALPNACRPRKRVQTSTQLTPDSIAACAYKQGFAANFGIQKRTCRGLRRAQLACLAASRGQTSTLLLREVSA